MDKSYGNCTLGVDNSVYLSIIDKLMYDFHNKQPRNAQKWRKSCRFPTKTPPKWRKVLKMIKLPSYEDHGAPFYWTSTVDFRRDPRISLFYDIDTLITTAVVDIDDVPLEHRPLLINLWKTRGWKLYKMVERHSSIGNSYIVFRKYVPLHP